MPTLDLDFAGTDQVWEDYAIFNNFGAHKRSNLNDPHASHFYHIFDGPASETSNQHLAVDTLFFDPTSPETDFMGSAGKSSVGRVIRHARGFGLNNTRETALEIIYHFIVNYGVREINLRGFSRGAVNALAVGACFSSLLPRLRGVLTEAEIEKIGLHIWANEPVAGIGRNKEIDNLGPLCKFVKTCTIFAAVNEFFVGLGLREPLSGTKRYQLKFESAATLFDVQLTTNDHLTSLVEAQDLLRQHLPPPLLGPCPADKLFKRRINKDPEVKWVKVDGTRANRVRHYLQHKLKYDFTLFNGDPAGQISLMEGIERYFQAYSGQRAKAKAGAPFLSIQNAADTEKEAARVYEDVVLDGRRAATKFGQDFSSIINTRRCKQKINEYTNHWFVNLFHEAMFAKQYPNMHAYLLSKDPKERAAAIKEYASIPEKKYPATYAILSQALVAEIPALKPLAAFKSTNYPSLVALLEHHLREPRPHMGMAEEKAEAGAKIPGVSEPQAASVEGAALVSSSSSALMDGAAAVSSAGWYSLFAPLQESANKPVDLSAGASFVASQSQSSPA